MTWRACKIRMCAPFSILSLTSRRMKGKTDSTQAAPWSIYSRNSISARFHSFSHSLSSLACENLYPTCCHHDSLEQLTKSVPTESERKLLCLFRPLSIRNVACVNQSTGKRQADEQNAVCRHGLTCCLNAHPECPTKPIRERERESQSFAGPLDANFKGAEPLTRVKWTSRKERNKSSAGDSFRKHAAAAVHFCPLVKLFVTEWMRGEIIVDGVLLSGTNEEAVGHRHKCKWAWCGSN